MHRALLAAVLVAACVVSMSVAASAHGYAGDARHRSMHHGRGPIVVLPARPRVVVVPRRPRIVVLPRHRHADFRVYRNGRWFIR